MRFPAALGPACMNVDRDRHTQGGQQPCLASASSPWQKISMRADNRTRNENNAVCQPRNPPCHSRTFAILGVFHEQSSTRKLNLKFNSSFSALIPGRISLQHLCENSDPEGAAVASRPWLQSQSGWFFLVFLAELSHFPSEPWQSSTSLFFKNQTTDTCLYSPLMIQLVFPKLLYFFSPSQGFR